MSFAELKTELGRFKAGPVVGSRVPADAEESVDSESDSSVSSISTISRTSSSSSSGSGSCCSSRCSSRDSHGNLLPNRLNAEMMASEAQDGQGQQDVVMRVDGVPRVVVEQQQQQQQQSNGTDRAHHHRHRTHRQRRNSRLHQHRVSESGGVVVVENGHMEDA